MLQLGLLYRAERLAVPEDLCTVLGPWAERAAETAGEVVTGPLALAYRGDQITPEDTFDVQPLRLGPDLLTWDGRLDNREELARRLGLPRACDPRCGTRPRGLPALRRGHPGRARGRVRARLL